ncbi:MAG: hypothetical protein DMG97_04155 [Acidobacteria bacterium]|nr:MAG: hypothetical protein DMG97_04155 [Acidobacteriota bacterium]
MLAIERGDIRRFADSTRFHKGRHRKDSWGTVQEGAAKSEKSNINNVVSGLTGVCVTGIPNR